MSKLASRRKNERKGCSVQANLQIGAHSFEATLNNFCAHGLLADCKPESFKALAHEQGFAQQGLVEVSCRIEAIHYQLTLEIRRTGDYFFGLYAAQGLPAHFLEAIAQVSTQTSAQIHCNEAGQKAAIGRFRLLVQEMMFIFDQVLMPTIARYFQRLPEQMMNSAEKALQSQQVQELFRVSGVLRQQHEALTLDYKVRARQMILAVLSDQPQASSAVFTQQTKGLSLVEADEFDQWVATKATAQRIENGVDQQLHSIISRLKPVLAQPEDSILLPQGQTRLLQILLTQNGVIGKGARVALDAFALELMPKYQVYLVRLDTLLEAKGFFARRDTTAEQAVHVKTEDATEQAATRHKDDQIQSANKDQMIPSDHLASARSSLGRAHTLLAGLRSLSHHAVPVVEMQGTLFLPRQELLRVVLSIFQTRLVNPDESNKNITMMAELEHYAQEKSSTIGSADHMAIELVDLFFNEMVRNEYLIEDIRTFLAQVRPLFLYDFLQKSDEKELRSDFQLVIFSVQEVANEPFAWTGRSKKSLQGAFAQFLELMTLDVEQLPKGLLNLSQTISTSMTHMNSVREVNKKRVIEAAKSRFFIQEKRNMVQVFLRGLVSKEGLVPQWFEQLMRMGWCEHLSFLAIRSLEQEYLQAINQTTMFFDVITNSASQGVAVDGALQDVIREIADHCCQTLTALNVNQAALVLWRDHIEDMMNQHESALSQMVPPSHWLIASGHNQSTRVSAYLTHKLACIELGSWLFCPHHDANKRHLKVVWIAPDQSRYLLVNHSFVGAGDLDHEAFVELLAKPGTRTVLENQLPFQSKGIEHYFHSMYDKIRGGLLRDKATGLFDKPGFEQKVQSLMNDETGFVAVLLQVPEEEAISTAYGAEFHTKFLAVFAEHLGECKFAFNAQQQGFLVSTVARFDGFFAFCFEQDDISQAVPSAKVDMAALPQLSQLVDMIEHRIQGLAVDQQQCHVSVRLSCVDTVVIDHPIAILMINAAKATFNGSLAQQDDQEGLGSDERIIFASNEHIQLVESKQAQFAWVQNVSKERLNEQVKLKTTLISSTGDKKYIKFTPIAHYEGIFRDLANSNHALVFNQWLIEQSIALSLEYGLEYKDIMVSLYLPAQVQTSFFEMIFDAISKMKSHKQVHFCFDAYQMPDIVSLQDFYQEVRSYGCQLMLSRWGCAQHSFEALLSHSFDFVCLDPAIEQREPQGLQRFANALETLAKASDVALVSPLTSATVMSFFSTIVWHERPIDLS